MLVVQAIEEGRMVTRDICGTDQEKMTALKVVDYIQQHFTGSGLDIKNHIITEEKWPLMAAVNRVNIGKYCTQLGFMLNQIRIGNDTIQFKSMCIS